MHSDSSGSSHTRRVLHFRSSSFCRIHQRPRGMHQPPPAPTNSDEPPPYSSLIWCPKPPSMKVSYSIADIAASHFHSRELKSVSLCNDCGQALSTHIYNLLHSDEWLTWYNPAAATGSSIRLLPPWFEGRLSVPVM